jgi:hypothetical protein
MQKRKASIPIRLLMQHYSIRIQRNTPNPQISKLSGSGWESLNGFLQGAVPQEGAVPVAVIAIQSFGDFSGFNPHLCILIFDGYF